MPVRDARAFIEQAIASILAQTFADFELLVVDDGSADGSCDRARAVDDARVRVVASRGTGIVAALNTGLAEARGALFARHDADDWSHPERLAAQVAFLAAHPHVAVVGSVADFVDDAGRPVETPWVDAVRRLHDRACTPEAMRELLPLTCGLVHGTVMARTAVLRDAGGYRPEFEWAEDYDLWLRLLPRHALAKLPRALYCHRLHGGQVSRGRRETQLRLSILAKLEYIKRGRPAVAPGTLIAVQGNGRGAVLYREMARHVGLAPVDADAPLFVVTDLDQLQYWRSALPADRWAWEGNIAIASGYRTEPHDSHSSP